MTITLTYLTTTITLSEDLRWTDEFDWQAVKQNVENTITGGIIVESAAILAGRPITLAPIDEGSAWTSLGDLRAVKAWADVAGRVMQLNIHGATYDVVFRHEEKGAITAAPVVFFSDAADTDYFLVTYKFTEVPT